MTKKIAKKTGGKLSVKHIQSFIKQSYADHPTENVDGYDLDHDLSHDTAKTYYHPSTKHAVVVHKGTSGMSDWLNNAAYATGIYDSTSRYKKGKAIQEAAERKYGSDNVSTLGHSQGSVLARKLGQNSKEIINVNPAYMGEKPTKKEYNIRSSGDLVSGLLAPVNKVGSYLFPSYAKDHDITIKAETSNPLTEHSSEILSRLPETQEVGAGRRGNGFVHQFLAFRSLHKGSPVKTIGMFADMIVSNPHMYNKGALKQAQKYGDLIHSKKC